MVGGERGESVRRKIVNKCMKLNWNCQRVGVLRKNPFRGGGIDIFWNYIKHLMAGPEANSEFCFLRISMFPETKSRETLRFEGKKIHCSPRDQSLSDLLYSKTKQKQILNNALRFQKQRSTFCG